MFEISKTFTFCAGHRLSGLPDSHKCARVHGHSYTVEVRVTAAGLAAPPGWITDYGNLAPFGTWLDRHWDHRWLGAGALTDDDGGTTEPVFDGNPTAELLAARFRAWILGGGVPALPAGASVAVGVSETPKTWAWAR